MELTLKPKTNRLAIVSFVSGLIALPAVVTFVVLLYGGTIPEPGSLSDIFMNLSRSIRDLATILALVTGIFALREIKKKGGMEKGKTLAWVGIIIGGAWLLFRVLIALFFIVASAIFGL